MNFPNENSTEYHNNQWGIQTKISAVNFSNNVQ